MEPSSFHSSMKQMRATMSHHTITYTNRQYFFVIDVVCRGGFVWAVSAHSDACHVCNMWPVTTVILGGIRKRHRIV